MNSRTNSQKNMLLEAGESILRVGSFHDLSMWEQHTTADGSPIVSAAEEESEDSRDHDDTPEKPRRSLKHAQSLRVVQALAPSLLDEKGTALSAGGVAAAAACGAAACHALRLLIRELLEKLAVTHSEARRLDDRPGSALLRARTLELYILSLLHHGAWVTIGARKLLLAARKGLRSLYRDGGGATRALCLSAGYHLYVLLSLSSIWTHPLVTLQCLGELVGVSAQLRSRDVAWIVPLSGALRCLPQLFLSACSALEHLGEPLSSYPFRLLRLCGLLSLVGAKAIATPLYLRATLSTRPELHQPAMLPRKLVTAADAALSVGWLASHFALHKAYRRWRHGLPSVVAPRLLAAAGGAAHQLRLQAAAALVTTGLQFLYLIPAALPALAAAALRLPARRRRLRALLLGAVGGLLALSRTRLPRPKYGLLRSLLLHSGLGSLLQEYHSFELIEEVPCDSLPTRDAGLLYACFPHGIVPYGVVLLWLERLRRGHPLGGLGASVLFRLPLLRQWLSMAGLEPATARNLLRRLRSPGCSTFLVPGGIAEMFLNDPDYEVVQLANRKGFCKHALRAGSPIVPVYIFGQTQLFYTFSGRLQQLMRRLSRALRVSLIPFVGRSWLSPFVPLQNPLTVVVGRPINLDVAPVEAPTAEQIDALHAEFTAELQRIFDTYKGRHPGYSNKRLYVAGEDDVTRWGEEEVEAIRERRRLEQFHLFPAKL